jgi:hypothetical protein
MNEQQITQLIEQAIDKKLDAFLQTVNTNVEKQFRMYRMQQERMSATGQGVVNQLSANLIDPMKADFSEFADLKIKTTPLEALFADDAKRKGYADLDDMIRREVSD